MMAQIDSGRYDQAAFDILFDLMQLVHTVSLFVRPFTTARTSWRFGSHLRRVRLCAWLILFPLIGLFPQISQTLAIVP
jgi:hypothetical protein